MRSHALAPLIFLIAYSVVDYFFLPDDGSMLFFDVFFTLFMLMKLAEGVGQDSRESEQTSTLNVLRLRLEECKNEALVEKIDSFFRYTEKRNVSHQDFMRESQRIINECKKALDL